MIAEPERLKLLEQREKIINDIEALKNQGPATLSASSKEFWMEDMKNLAKKVVSIDKKLGRV